VDRDEDDDVEEVADDKDEGRLEKVVEGKVFVGPGRIEVIVIELSV
jgi:hypothetical protein